MTTTNDIFYCGLDVGGANTKCVILKRRNSKEMVTVESRSIYFPFWEKKNEFPDLIKELVSSLEKKFSRVDFGITITAELSDAFETKKEGIKYIVRSFSEVTTSTPRFYTVNGSFLPPEKAISNWLEIAASNWHATATIVGRFFLDALLVDIGSTTTDIIRIYKGKPCPQGFTDTKRLQTGELVFVGALRTNLATLSNELLIDDVPTQTSSEIFACTADILRVLGKIKSEDYTIPTPDGKSASRKHCLGRIARVVCADRNTLREEQITDLARQLLLCLIQRIQQSVKRQVRSNLSWPPKCTVLAGIGAKTLGLDVVAEIPTKIAYLSDIIGEKEAEIAPAYSVAFLLSV
ncbi:MAG: hydantoinase/oxoprolinase family protein [Candidatus Hodarchaeales archaeon]